MEWNEVFKNKIKSWNGLILGIVLIAVILPENIDWRWQVVLRKGSWRRDQEDSANITRITTFFSCNMQVGFLIIFKNEQKNNLRNDRFY